MCASEQTVQQHCPTLAKSRRVTPLAPWPLDMGIGPDVEMQLGGHWALAGFEETSVKQRGTPISRLCDEAPHVVASSTY